MALPWAGSTGPTPAGSTVRSAPFHQAELAIYYRQRGAPGRIEPTGRSPYQTQDGSGVVGSGVVEGQGELLLASRAVLGRYVVMSSGVVKPSRMSQG